MKKFNILNINMKHSYVGKHVAEFLERWAVQVSSNIWDNYNSEDIRTIIESLFFKVYKFNGTRQEMLNTVFGTELNQYLPQDTFNNAVAEEKNEGNIVLADSGFNMQDNSFHFQNLFTKVGDGGVCAGMAYIVSNAYNNNEITDKVDIVPEFNPYEYETPTYDISNTDVFGCITKENNIGNYSMGEILQSYSNSSLTDDYYNSKISGKKIIDTSISNEAEKNDIKLLKAIEYYFSLLNNKTYFLELDIRKLVGLKTEKQKFSEIEDLIEYVKQGKVAICGLYGKNDRGHAINVYKVEQDSSDADVYYLKCYDNNLPLNTYINYKDKNYIRENVDITIKVVRHKMGTELDTYDFTYDIFKNKSYRYSSEDGDRIAFFTSEIEQIK